MNTKMPDDLSDESADHIIEFFSKLTDVLELYYLSSMMRYIRNNILPKETKNHSEVAEDDPPF